MRPGAEIPIRTLRNLSLNPNLGGAPMVVSLGCEKLQPVRLLPSNTLPILGPQLLMSFACRMSSTTASAIWSLPSWRLAEKRLAELNRRTRVTRPASDLVVGLQCGGSDAFSGVTANPAVGYASDLVGSRWRHRNVLRSHRGPRRDPSANGARGRRTESLAI